MQTESTLFYYIINLYEFLIFSSSIFDIILIGQILFFHFANNIITNQAKDVNKN